jgi:hypothetical protein
MTTGRQNYTPAPPPRPALTRGLTRALLGVPLGAMLVIGTLATVRAYQDAQSAAIVQAFRAGVQAATETGCRQSLALPVGARP